MNHDAMITAYQRRWLLRVMLLRRFVWIAAATCFFAVFLNRAGFSLVVFELAGACAFIFLTIFVLFALLSSCPRCGKNFYSSWFRGANAFTSRCMNCRLSWKELR